MVEFRPTTIADREWIVSLFQAEGIALSSYSFTALFCWRHVYKQEVCRLNDRLLVRAQTNLGLSYLWPAGKGDLKPAMQAIEEDAKRQGEQLRLIGIPDDKREQLKNLYGSRLKMVYIRDYYDYLYDINRLADLPGKKLHSKRNHINRFKDHCPDWSFEALTKDDVEDCVALDQQWYDAHVERADREEEKASLMQERQAMLLALTHFEDLGMDGGVIRCAEKVVSFTLGSHLTNDVYDVHFERANTDIQGTFPIINQEFAKYIRNKYPEIKFIDREEDMGQPGLRKSKLSYVPDQLVENFIAVIVEEEKEDL